MRTGQDAELRAEEGIAYLEGDLTLDHASRLLQLGKEAIDQGVRGFNLSRSGHMDSSAISLLLSLRRHAEANGSSIEFHAVPDKMRSLATLYGVAEHL
jgi:ABC-type transporter Mla MlaB component